MAWRIAIFAFNALLRFLAKRTNIWKYHWNISVLYILGNYARSSFDLAMSWKQLIGSCVEVNSFSSVFYQRNVKLEVTLVATS
jgi:hypothetical protein